MSLADLRQYNPMLADEVVALEAQARQLGASNGAQQLTLVAGYFQKLSLDEAHRMLALGEFQREVEESLLHKAHLKGLNYLRAFFGLAPLIWTWYALSEVSTGFKLYMDLHTTDQSQPLVFLKLWQDGVLGPGWLTFSTTAIIDVVLLGTFLALNLLSLFLEYHARQRSVIFAANLQRVVNQLMEAVANEGVSQLTSDAQVDRVVKAIQRVLTNAFHASQQTAQAAKTAVQDLFDKLQPVVEQFGQDTKNLHLDLDRLSSDLDQLRQDLDKVKDLATASKELATSAQDLAKNAGKYTTIGQNIDTHILALTQSEQEMVTNIADAQKEGAKSIRQGMFSVADTIARTQKDITDEIAKTAGSMSGAASMVASAVTDMNTVAEQVKEATKAVENASAQLTQIKEADITKMTEPVMNLASEADKVVGALSQVEQKLRETASRLLEASSALHTVLDVRSPSRSDLSQTVRRPPQMPPTGALPRSSYPQYPTNPPGPPVGQRLPSTSRSTGEAWPGSSLDGANPPRPSRQNMTGQPWDEDRPRTPRTTGMPPMRQTGVTPQLSEADAGNQTFWRRLTKNLKLNRD